MRFWAPHFAGQMKWHGHLADDWPPSASSSRSYPFSSEWHLCRTLRTLSGFSVFPAFSLSSLDFMETQTSQFDCWEVCPVSALMGWILTYSSSWHQWSPTANNQIQAIHSTGCWVLALATNVAVVSCWSIPDQLKDSVCQLPTWTVYL